MNTWIDTHCHLTFKNLKEPLPSVLKRAEEAGVKKLINICCEIDEIEDVCSVGDAYDFIYASVGIHPHEAQKELEKHGEKNIYNLLKNKGLSPKVVGLGETGLDYYYEHSPRLAQESAFKIHLDLACDTSLPLIVHTRSAEEETISLLKSYQGKVQGVIHCFSGTQWLADQALELGFYISISGIATFPKAQNIRDVIKTIPLDRLVLETDAPYLAPVPHRGKSNEPSFLPHTAQVVADLKEVSLDVLSKTVFQNTHKLFKKLSGE